MLGNIEQFMPKREQKKLNDANAWYNIFLEQITKRISEAVFSVLFDDVTGRPNASIRLLVAMLILKEGFNWSDEVLFESVHFNLLVRRALGLFNLTDEVPVVSTYYLFKQRLYRYQVEHGKNLLNEVFQDLTNDQIQRLGVIGDRLRMDSGLLGSNIATCSRLQLIIACLQIFWKGLTNIAKNLLDEADRILLDQLCSKPAQRQVYSLDSESKRNLLENLGKLLLRINKVYNSRLSSHYALIERLIVEQYQVYSVGEEQQIVSRPGKEISPESMQSPYDQDATYRKKNDVTVIGYSFNVTETCTEELNLIVDVQVEPATIADKDFFIDAVNNSETVLEKPAKEIYVDGAYYSTDNEEYINEGGKEAHYTGFPGKKGRYDYERTDAGIQVKDCNNGMLYLAEEYKPGRYRFFVDGQWQYFTDKNINTSECRRRTENLPRELFNRRCNVEATIFQMSYHARRKKLKYRGQFRNHLWAICRAAWINLRRICIYQAKPEPTCA